MLIAASNVIAGMRVAHRALVPSYQTPNPRTTTHGTDGIAVAYSVLVPSDQAADVVGGANQITSGVGIAHHALIPSNQIPHTNKAYLKLWNSVFLKGLEKRYELTMGE